MNSIGEIVSALFDERFIEKAQGYSKLFNSWKSITEKNGIASAVDHSRIKELEKGILCIEVDHPGWKQILQTKQSKLLYDFRVRFPDLDISGLSLMLGNGRQKTEENKIDEDPPITQPSDFQSGGAQQDVTDESEKKKTPPLRGYDSIKDEDFRESLRKLGQTIEDSSH